MQTIKTYFYVFCGVAVIGWSIATGLLRNDEGLLLSQFCFMLSVGIALIWWGFAARSRFRKSTGWFLLAVLGQAAALQLISAGPFVAYQHYRSPAELLRLPNVLFTTIVLIQTGILVLFGRATFRQSWHWLRNHFRSWQLIFIFAVFFFSSATLSRQVSFYAYELILATLIQLVNLMNILVFVHSLPTEILQRFRQFLQKHLSPESEKKPLVAGFHRMTLLLALWVFAISLMLNIISYERHPHVPDEVVYLIHANYFSQGKLTMPLPPVPEAFNINLMYYGETEWFCPVPLGWPAMLAIGSFIRMPWIINPLLGGLNLLLIFALIRLIFDRRIAHLTVFLLSFSPWYIFMAMNFMTHTFTLTCALVGALGVAHLRARGNLSWAIVAGIGIGCTSLVRPLDGLIVAIVLGFWALGIKGWRAKIQSVLVVAIVTITVSSITLPYNKRLTGDPFYFPIMAYIDKYYGPGQNSLGFGPEKGLGWTGLDPFPGHGPLDVVVNSNQNLFSINIELFGWSIGSVLLMVLLLAAKKIERRDYWMLFAVFVVVFMHAFYWFSGGPDFGARYWYLVIVPCVVLTIRGADRLIELLSAGDSSKMPAEGLVYSPIFALCLITLINYFPWRAVDKYHNYRGMRSDIRQIADIHQFGKDLILVKGKRHPDYMSAAVYNPVNLNSDLPLYAWDRDSLLTEALIRSFPERRVWKVNGPSVTGAGYQILEAPAGKSRGASTKRGN